MDAVTRSIVQAGMDASNYVAGARQVEQANKGIAGSSEQVAASQQRAEQTTNRSSRSFERLQQELDRNYAAMQRFERAQESINRALERGSISQERASQLTQLAQARYERSTAAAAAATTSIAAFAAANDNAATRTGRLNNAILQGGFQLQDFAVQVQGGTSFLTALAQQGSQFLGVFGPGGAIAGAALAVGALAAGLLTGRDNADAFRLAEEALGETFSRNRDIIRDLTQETNNLAVARANAGIADTQEQLGRARLAQDRIEQERQILQRENDLARRSRGALDGGLVTQNQQRLEELNQRAQRAGQIADRIQEDLDRLTTLRQQFIAGEGLPTPPRQAAEPAEDGSAERRQERIAERVADALRNAEATAAGQRRIADAYGQADAAGRRAEAMERALAAIRKTGSEVTAEEASSVVRLAQAFEAEARARADVQSRASARSLQDEIGLIDAQNRLLTASVETRERELAAVRARQQILGRGGDPESDASRAYIDAAQAAASARIEQQRMASGLQEVQRIGEQAFSRIGEAITQAFVSGESAAVSWGNVAKALVSEVAQALVRLAVINPIMNAVFGTSQNTLISVLGSLGGAAGGAGGVNANWAPSAAAVGPYLAFADGGVVTRPTVFGMAGGTGIMGEAGPEAILPLRRGADGKLGVAAAGGGAAISQTINVNVSGGGGPGMGGNVSPDQARIIAAEVQKAARAAAEDAIRNNMRLGGMLNPSSGRAA